jgi:hypothetical protein
MPVGGVTVQVSDSKTRLAERDPGNPQNRLQGTFRYQMCINNARTVVIRPWLPKSWFNEQLLTLASSVPKLILDSPPKER